MKLKTLVALAVAGAFAVPLVAQASADGDRILLADGPSGAGAVGTGPTGGVPSPQSAGEPRASTPGSATAGPSGTYHSLDANRDGYVSREEAGRESSLNFSELDKDGDGRLSSSEMSAWQGGAASSGATGGASAAPSGPGTASRAGPGSDTATTPSTSGKGKAQ